MRTRPKITSIEIMQFELALQDVAPEPTIGMPIYKPGSVMKRRRHAIRIHSDLGVMGEYTSGSAMDYAAIAGFAANLIGRNPLQREDIYNDFKQAMRQQARTGVGVVDIALWDWAGKYHNAPIYEVLGGSQQKLPCYASTYLGDHEAGGLSSPEAYADFAEQCLEMGYPAYKIHGWQSAPLKDQIAVVHAVGKRVGGKMDLMLDPFCAIKTFSDALKLDWACDEYGFLGWCKGDRCNSCGLQTGPNAASRKAWASVSSGQSLYALYAYAPRLAAVKDPLAQVF